MLQLKLSLPFKKIKGLSILLIFISLTLFSSCKKNVMEETIEPPPSSASWDETVEAVAKDVSHKLNNVAFRQMLKHEVLLRFDGDANILLQSMVARLPKYVQYEAKPQATMGIQEANGNSRISDLNFDLLKEAAKVFPQMQIAVQTRAEKWDAKNFVPSVVFVPADFDEKLHKNVKGFDPAKKPITVSTETDPDVNYVVISLNERTMIGGDGNLYYSNSICPVEISYAAYDPSITPESLPPPEECDGGGGGGSGGGGTGGTTHPQYNGTGQDGVLPSLIGSQMGTIVSPNPNGMLSTIQPVGSFNGEMVYRKNFRHEKMRWMKLDNISDIEAWPGGPPEIRMHIFEQNVLNPSENLQIFKEKFNPPSRSAISDYWFNANGVTMHLWDYAGTGTKFSVGYYEYDVVLVPNETLESIGAITVDLLFLQTIDSSTTANYMTIYGNVRQSVQTGIRSLKRKNNMSEYIGKDDYEIRNNNEHWVHNPGGANFTTWPDL